MVGSYEGSHVMVISPHAVAIVGFSSGEKVVNEGERVGVCASVTEPGSSLVMLLNFFLVVDLIPLTEGLCVVCVRVCVCACMCVCMCIRVIHIMLYTIACICLKNFENITICTRLCFSGDLGAPIV